MIGVKRVHFCLTLVETLLNSWQQKVANFRHRQDPMLEYEVMCATKVKTSYFSSEMYDVKFQSHQNILFENIRLEHEL